MSTAIQAATTLIAGRDEDWQSHSIQEIVAFRDGNSDERDRIIDVSLGSGLAHFDKSTLAD